MSDKTIFSSGESPSSGVYVCMQCGEAVLIPEMADKLPHCPKCDQTLWLKV